MLNPNTLNTGAGGGPPPGGPGRGGAPARREAALLQQAIDAGFDDVRASVHNTGCLDDPNLIVA